MDDRDNNSAEFWQPDEIADAYRRQGVTWSEEEIRQKAEEVALEMRRADWREHARDRTVRVHEIPCGLLRTDADADELRKLEYLVRKWDPVPKRSHSRKRTRTAVSHLQVVRDLEQGRGAIRGPKSDVQDRNFGSMNT